MARRTTADAVAAVLGADWDGRRPLVPFIDSVTGIVDEVVRLAANKGGPRLTAAQAEIVERWLAAWAYAMADRPLDVKNSGKAGGTFSGKTDMGMEANTYGQTAIRMDPTSTLRAINKGNVLGSAWLGKTKSEQVDYDDRN